MTVPNVNVKQLEDVQKMMCDSRLRYGLARGMGSH
jgi:hypothetical protein